VSRSPLSKTKTNVKEVDSDTDEDVSPVGDVKFAKLQVPNHYLRG
jgi:hypothetical protein